VSPLAEEPVAINDCRPRLRADIFAKRCFLFLASSCSTTGGGATAGAGAGMLGELNPTAVIKDKKSITNLQKLNIARQPFAEKSPHCNYDNSSPFP
jgi:hypothetical protein